MFSINIIGLQNLNYLNCQGNQIASINLTTNNNLTDLILDNNLLTSLNMYIYANQGEGSYILKFFGKFDKQQRI